MTSDDTVPDLGIELPTDAAEGLQAAVGLESPPETFHGWMAELYESFGQGPNLTTADLFLDEPSRHAVHLDDGVEHVPCVLDALIVAARIEADPVVVRSTSPTDGTVVELSVGDGTVDVTPADAVMSFGLSTALPSVGEPDEPPLTWVGEPDSPLRALSCDYINAFEDRAAFDRWADELDGVVVLPLTFEQGRELAEVAVDRLFA